MPIVERDPWRMQYFDGVDCPADLMIPTEDGDAWQWFPEWHWVYNKLQVAESQACPRRPTASTRRPSRCSANRSST